MTSSTVILHSQISIVRSFSSNWQYWFFGPILPKKLFPVKNWKREHHWIPHIQISLGTKFELILTILIVLTRFTQKGFIWSKTEKWTPHIFNIILHIQISLVRNFSSDGQFWFFGPNFPKRYFQSKTEKVNITMEFCIFELV